MDPAAGVAMTPRGWTDCPRRDITAHGRDRGALCVFHFFPREMETYTHLI